jgi:2-deoxy-D-gluconate 3-dehydrogenase
MANELAPSGINVNAIAPGYMATDNTAALRADPPATGSILDRIPAGRWGQPEDHRRRGCLSGFAALPITSTA